MQTFCSVHIFFETDGTYDPAPGMTQHISTFSEYGGSIPVTSGHLAGYEFS
jgi:hypothetical protein